MARRILRSGVGRAALIAGAATAASRLARRPNHKPGAASHKPNAATKDDDVAGSLKRLAELRESGALTDREFKAAKAKLLF